MTILFEDESKNSGQLDFDYRELLDKVTGAVLDHEEFPHSFELSVLFTDNEGIQEINRDHRDIDAPTDVLSFPMMEFYGTPGIEGFDEEACDRSFESGDILLGDIVLNIDRVISQAEEYGHSTKREYAFLIVHSMLHLLGYDHIEEDDRIIMESRQKDIMQELGINR